MKNRSSRRGCLLGGLALLILLLMIGGGWWLYRSQSLSLQGGVVSPVVVTIASPASGDDVDAGDFVSISAQAYSADSVQVIELFLDGQSLGKLTDPANASWTWQAWPLGIHSFYAQATDSKGRIGYSQVVLVNVLTGDGTLEVAAQDGQTLDQIGAGYGVPPDQMTGANPKIPPAQPLPGGYPVQVPVNTVEPQSLPSTDQISIKWKIKITEPVDKFYCYVSTGNGVWEKIPKGPFNYFFGQENFYTQLIPNNGQVTLQLQCWGWAGGKLKYLGQGQGGLDASKPQGEVNVDGGGFIFTGFYKTPPLGSPPKALGGKLVTPPYALRETSSISDCASHGDPIVVPLLCNGILNAKVKEHVVLVWEWSPKLCVFGVCKWNNEIAGYGVYEIDPATNTRHLVADIKPPLQKAAFIPLPWGAKCYGVEAYVDLPGSQVSEMAEYCPGDQPKTQVISLTPTLWVTTGGQWIQDGDCDTYGGADAYLLANQNEGFGNSAGQVLVGSYLVDDEDEDCYREGNYSGAVKFDLQSKLPPGAAIQKAELVFLTAFMDYGATGWASPAPSSCVKNVGKAKQEWSGLLGSAHFYDKNVLTGPGYFSPITSMFSFGALNADVTSTVKDWVKNPGNNHGFILTPVGAPHPSGDGNGRCESGLGNFQLNIHYFAQP